MSIRIIDLGRLIAEKASDEERANTLLQFASEVDAKDLGEFTDRMLGIIDMPSELRGRYARAVAIHLMAFVGLAEGNVEAVMPDLQRALASYRELGDSEAEGVLLLQLASAERNRSNDIAAREYAVRALAIFEATENERMVARCYNKIGKTYAEQSDHGTALEYLRRAEKINERLGWMAGYANDLNSIGAVYHSLSNYDRALEYLLKGLAVSETLEDVDDINRSLLNTARVYMDLKDYDRALEHLYRAYSLAEKRGDRRQMSKLLHNIGTAYSERGESDRALEAFQRVLVEKEHIGDRRGVAHTLNSLGNIYQNLGDYDHALDYYRRSLAIKEELGNRRAIVSTLMNMGSVYIACGNMPEAFDILHRGLAVAEETGNKASARDIHRNLAEAYKKTGDFPHGLEHLERFAALDKEIFDETSAKRLHELTVVFEVERAEREANILRLTNERLEQEIEFKMKELTTNALYLTQKNETLLEVRRQIDEIRKNPEAVVIDQLRLLAEEIDQAVNADDYWATFEKQFKQVHRDFLETLTERYPKLTPTELKVCALIKIDLSTKEIAQILNAEPRSVEKYRQRIRKKLMLRQDENLSAFLMAIR